MTIQRTAHEAETSRPPRYQKLKPGPGRSAEAVGAHQRRRIHRATIELVAEGGYEALTVRELARRAGVSQATLYKHFASKQECFLASYELIARCGLRHALAAQRSGSSRRERLRLGVAALVEALAGEPRAARLALVESFSAWPHCLGRMERANGLFETVFGGSAADAPEPGIGSQFSPARAIVAGVACVARQRLLGGRERELAGLGGELSAWALSLSGEEAGEAGALGVSGEALRTPRFGAAQELLDERSLLVEAAASLAAEEGFEQLSVPRIRAVAGLPRRSFDACFEDATDCFLAAFEQRGGRALAYAATHAGAAGGWPASVCRAIAAFCELVARDQGLARLLFVEILASGRAGIRCRARLLAGLARSLHASAPAGGRPSVVAAEASLGAIWDLLYTEIAAGRSQRLPQRAGAFSFIVLAPALDPQAAVAAIRAA